MAQIKEGSIIKKVAGDEIIATIVDVNAKVDKVTDKSLVLDTEITKLNAISGSNTGDQDISGKQDKVFMAQNQLAYFDSSGQVLSTGFYKNNLISNMGDTFFGPVIGNNNTSYTTSQLRNARIYADGATVPTLANGEIAFIYEV